MQYMNAHHIVRHPRTLQTPPVTLSTLIIYTMSFQHIKSFFLIDLMTSGSMSPFSLICLDVRTAVQTDNNNLIISQHTLTHRCCGDSLLQIRSSRKTNYSHHYAHYITHYLTFYFFLDSCRRVEKKNRHIYCLLQDTED